MAGTGEWNEKEGGRGTEQRTEHNFCWNRSRLSICLAPACHSALLQSEFFIPGYPAAAFPAEDGSTYLASLMGEAGTEAPDTAADRTASVDVEFHVYTRYGK